MAALSPPRLFAAWRVEAPFFCGFPFRWVLHFVISLAGSVNVHDTTSCSREDSLYDCGCPCDTLSCFFFTALCLRQSQSISVQETWQPKDIDFTCYKTLLTKSITCLPVGTMSLEWPVALPAGSDQYSPPSSHEDHIGEHQCDALPASPHLRWRRDALQPPQVQQDGAGRNTCVRFPDGGLRCVTWNTRSHWVVFSSQRNMQLKLNYFARLIENNNIICLQEVHGKNEFFQAIQVWAPRFRLFCEQNTSHFTFFSCLRAR